jgi:hypothetical protein
MPGLFHAPSNPPPFHGLHFTIVDKFLIKQICDLAGISVRGDVLADLKNSGLEVFRTEGHGKKFTQGEAGPDAGGTGGMDWRRGTGEFAESLAASAAGRDERRARAADENFGYTPVAAGDHGGDGAGFRAGSHGIGGVLDVGADVDRPALAPDRGADKKLRIRCIGARLCRQGGVQQIGPVFRRRRG